jgi:Alpha/beta hydrolase family
MADHIDGPLYYERMGRTGPVMAFVHPNPMDQSCWIFQMAHMSTWFRCIAIDIPGYGRSPKARDGLTMRDMAEGCWEAIETEFPKEPAILVGCSVGSATSVPSLGSRSTGCCRRSLEAVARRKKPMANQPIERAGPGLVGIAAHVRAHGRNGCS